MRIKGRVLMPMPTAHGRFLSPTGPRILPGNLHVPTQRRVVVGIHIDHSVREIGPRRKGLAVPNRTELPPSVPAFRGIHPRVRRVQKPRG